MYYFLYHRTTAPTGRVLARALGFRFCGRRPKKERGNYNLVLRWGSSLTFPASLEINYAEGISRAADKLSTFRILQDAGVSIVPFTTNPNELDGLVYGRSRFGSRGNNIRVFEEGTQPYGCEFYTQGVDIYREYRIHVVGEQVVRVQGKYLDFPEQDMTGGRVYNYANGYRFKTPQKLLPLQQEQEAIMAVKSLGLDFGAVDLIVDENKKHYILEVNTGPSCSPMTARAYITALAALIAERTEGRWEPQVNTDALSALRHCSPVTGGN